MPVLLGDIKDPAWLAKLMARQRRHSFEDRHLPLFRENQNPEALFNSDGEQDIGNPLLASWGKLGRDYIYLLSELENSQELDAFVDITPDNLLHRIQADILELESHAVAGVNLEEYSRSDNKRLLDPRITASLFTFVTARSAGGNTARSPAGDAGSRSDANAARHYRYGG